MAIVLAGILAEEGRASVVVADVALAAEARALHVRGDHAYVGTVAGLEVVDLRDPRAPEIAALATPCTVLSIVLSGDLAYLGCSTGLRIADVSDPSAPREVGHLDLPGVTLSVALAADGQHAFLATDQGLRVVDVTDAPAPEEIAFVSGPRIRGLQRIGTSLFAVTQYTYLGGVAVFDVSDPGAPAPLPSIPPHGVPDEYGYPSTTAIGVEGETLWVFDASQYSAAIWRRFDVANAAAPVPLDTVFPNLLGGHGPERVSVGAGILDWVECLDACKVIRFDLENAASPARIGSMSMRDLGSAAAVASWGERAYLANGSRLRVVDFSSPQWPTALDSLASPTSGVPSDVRDIDRVGSLAYVVAGERGIHVVDVSDPAELGSVGFRAAPYGRNASDITVDPPIAFVADPAGVRIASVADPANPYILADPAVPAWSVELADGFVYAAAGAQGLLVWRADDPMHPEIVGTAPGIDARDVALANGRAHVIGLTDSFPLAYELVIIDVSNPLAPDEIHRFDLPVPAREEVDVEVRDSLAYVALGREVHVIDLASPTEPVMLGSFVVCGFWADLEIVGDRLFAAGSSCGLGVFDLANPVSPYELGIVADDATSSSVAGRIAFVGMRTGALESFDLGPELAPVPEPSALVSSGAALAALMFAASARRRQRRRSARRRSPACRPARRTRSARPARTRSRR